MKTASKLAQIARANQDKQEKVKLIKDGKVVFVGTRELSEEYISENGGTYTTVKYKPQSFEKKVAWGSHQYVRYVKDKCKEIAQKGYGSVDITIDKTTDLFNIDEGRGTCYSAQFVMKLLSNEGFTFDTDDLFVDHYDAISTTLVWDSSLPKSLDSCKIGMSFLK